MKDLKTFCAACDRVYCYGTGETARVLNRYFRQQKIHISGYFVTKQGTTTRFRGKEVREFSPEQISATDGVIITVTAEDFIVEIRHALEAAGCQNIFLAIEDRGFLSFSRKSYRKKISQLRRCSVFDYQTLMQEVDYAYSPQERRGDSFAYGIYRCVRKYVKNPCYDVRKCAISHGTLLAPFFTPWDLHPADGNCFTMSRLVWEEIPNVSVHALGPYILYAKPLYTYPKLQRLKRRLGKTLLFFPVHASSDCKMPFDAHEAIRRLQVLKKQYGFRTVLVCMYYMNLQQGEHLPYLQAGFQVVTAGSSNDPSFLSRLRSIIQLGDVGVTNAVGTHMGYCVSLGLPVYFLKMVIDRSGERGTLLRYMAGRYSDALRDQVMQAEGEIEACFREYREFITEEQYRIIEKYWGKWNRRRHLR